MRICRLSIHNFRAIALAELTDLGDVVVIAAPNGCGKSAILDAMRLLKSVYGGYQPNEWQQWMSEFQISINSDKPQLLGLLQDKSRPLRVDATIRLDDEECAWIIADARNILRDLIWKQVAPEVASWRHVGSLPLAAQLRTHEPEVERRIEEELPRLVDALRSNEFVGSLKIDSTGNITITPSPVLEIVFTMYDPQHIGVIDYHGAQRQYQREQIGGINLNIETSEQQLRQHALYNYANKYANVKTELAAAFVRDLIAGRAGQSNGVATSITETLAELFTTFFPGKEFLGPQPTTEGALLFNVRTESGAIHDINDLSSGEKEVLYGYLRLRNTAPKNSVILIDEPELHLNPRLIQGLPDFYHRHLGRALNNQLWLVTHSDALLRQAVGHDGFKVFHMQAATIDAIAGNQVREVRANAEVERVIIDLVGDLAAYRPGAKLVVLEGGGDAEFDVRMVTTVFPDFASEVNLLSGGNKNQVRNLHGLLEQARAAGALPGKFYSIADRDFEEDQALRTGPVLTWDRFHIENYLLEPRYILRVLRDIRVPGADGWDGTTVDGMLVACAELTLASLVRYYLDEYAHRKLRECIRTNFSADATDLSAALAEAVSASAARIQTIATGDLAASSLLLLEDHHRKELQVQLEDGRWRTTFRGRDILRRFADRYVTKSVGYTVLRDLVIARMRDESFQPSGMREVLESVISPPWKGGASVGTRS